MRRRVEEVYSFLEAYIAGKARQIEEIEQAVDRYQKKSMREEQAYQTMSPLRRMLIGKKPDHHLALEYIHYVQKPLEKAKLCRSAMVAAIQLLKEAEGSGTLVLPEDLEDEFNK